jgi:hypothetical protein
MITVHKHRLKAATTPEATSSTIEDQELQALDLAFLGSLLPGIIHNLATPLSGVLGATQLLEKRASALEELVAQQQGLSGTDRAELAKQFDRNRTNVDILARNAKHLADVLQILVHRINRSTSITQEFYPLNDLLQQELRFLEANLNFKHKVKKLVTLGPERLTEKFVYGYVVVALDEFVTGTLAQHDFSKGTMEMDFATQEEPTMMRVVVSARFTPKAEADETGDALAIYLERLQTDGWRTECTASTGTRELRLTIPRRDSMS